MLDRFLHIVCHRPDDSDGTNLCKSAGGEMSPSSAWIDISELSNELLLVGELDYLETDLALTVTAVSSGLAVTTALDD